MSNSIKARFITLAAVGVFYPAAALGAALCATTMFSGPAYANTGATISQAQHVQPTVSNVAFQKKSFKIKGDVSVEQRGDKTFIVFSDDFRTKNGPDLKIFLSKSPVADATGRNATQNAIKIDVLKSNKGGQSYELPAGINLADFNSILIHCEAYSKLWGGADLT